MTESAFLFAVCQAGSEGALKREVAREHPSLRLAFSRPGFLTFKSPSPLGADVELRSVFARVSGLSLGRAPTPDHDLVHRYSRDGLLPLVREGRPAEPGERVLDRVIVDPGEEWVGLHLHGPGRSAHPAGNPALALPSHAPSRAYQKLAEALLWSGAQPQPGECALEIGSAPGGAALLLLEKGLHVIGVDPAPMAPRVLASKAFTHLKRGAEKLTPKDLPRPPDWLLLDVNLPPEQALPLIEPFAAGCRGLLLTLKIHDDASADRIPRWLARLGLPARATQLPSHKSEILVYASQRA